MTRSRILEVLRSYAPMDFPAGDARASAVLVPLREVGPGGLDVILTRRAANLDDHAGQVAFPGGRLEAGESAEQGALREAYEELAIPPERVDIVGRLDPMTTITGYHVVPVVGRLAEDVIPVPDPREVARVFSVPLVEFLREERWQRREHAWRGNRLWVWHFPHDGEDVWGATGMMLRSMVELLWQRVPPPW
ncbi:MAG: CoA pyrophosphatase [Deltaproteobacteria bacterium]|nr:CoA pyrophosphatase [Deltaproteobacteria bacterium]